MKEIYSVFHNACKGEYWLEEDGIAITGNLHGVLGIKDLNMLVNALNALHEIKELLPNNPKLPLVNQIKELVEKGLKNAR